MTRNLRPTDCHPENITRFNWAEGSDGDLLQSIASSMPPTSWYFLGFDDLQTRCLRSKKSTQDSD